MSEAIKVSPEVVVGSLTGFDEVAVQGKFRSDIADLTSTMTLRALAFVLLRRQDGMDDKSAYSRAMNMTLLEVKDMFAIGDEDAGDSEGND
jgi:hypothetical protein